MKFPQLVQSWAHPRPTSALFPDDSLAPVPIVDLNEIRRVSRFLPLIVLIPKSHAVKDYGVPPKIAASASSQSSEAARVLGLPGKAVEQFKSTNMKNEFAFGDANGRQTHFKVAAKTRTRTVAATTFSSRPRGWLQVLALARSTLTMGGHARGFLGSPWRC